MPGPTALAKAPDMQCHRTNPGSTPATTNSDPTICILSMGSSHGHLTCAEPSASPAASAVLNRVNPPAPDANPCLHHCCFHPGAPSYAHMSSLCKDIEKREVETWDRVAVSVTARADDLLTLPPSPVPSPVHPVPRCTRASSASIHLPGRIQARHPFTGPAAAAPGSIRRRPVAGVRGLPEQGLLHYSQRGNHARSCGTAPASSRYRSGMISSDRLQSS